jgi:hypothetical protein
LCSPFSKPARFYVSHPILEGYADVLSRQELGIRKGVRQQLLQFTRNHSYIVTPARRREVAGDPDDNKTTLLADQRLLFVRGAARVVLRAWRPHEFPNMLAVYYRAHPIQHLA